MIDTYMFAYAQISDLFYLKLEREVDVLFTEGLILRKKEQISHLIQWLWTDHQGPSLKKDDWVHILGTSRKVKCHQGLHCPFFFLLCLYFLVEEKQKWNTQKLETYFASHLSSSTICYSCRIHFNTFWNIAGCHIWRWCT